MGDSRDDVRDKFPTTDRFELISELGAGGMGVVYEVHDRDQRVRMALKSLQQVGPREILRLKHEFRALHDLHHVNLVRLGELFEHDGAWFFTMELVDGTDFLRWVRGDAGAAVLRIARGSSQRSDPAAPTRVTSKKRSASTERGERHGHDGATTETQAGTPSTHALAVAAAPPRPDPAVVRDRPSFDEARLRAALRELCSGLAALHRAGMVHRDVKPSNVLVEPGGRVVLLDFGVVGELERPGAVDGPGEIVGTWAYMAPEQGIGHGADAPADWYAVGVMLFQALTGALPFPPGRASLAAKMAFEPPSPDELTEDLPPDLVSLCQRLLARDASLRPAAAEILASLGATAEGGATSYPGLSRQDTPFVGRGEELALLRAALARVRAGRPAWVVVGGESGVGKSTLVRRFLHEAALTLPAPLVLAGRCDAREIVPYNAFVVDQLARALEHLPAVEQAQLRPAGLGALLTVFPVLSSVEGFAGQAEGAPPADPRSAAFAALAALLHGLSRRAPLVLLIDDLHRADADSLALLRELSGGPEPPPFLLLGTARLAPAGEALAALAALPSSATELRLEGLTVRDAAELIALVADVPVTSADAAVLIREAGGHPMFLLELTRLRARDPAHPVIHLDEALWQRIESLPADGRLLIQVVALAGTPLSLGLAAEAAQLAPEAFVPQLAALRAARLLRIGEGRARDAVEPYHDRVRETVSARLPEHERRTLHHRLARVLAANGAPPELCAHHHAGAGERRLAADYAEEAARRAAASLAFDHAADWFRTALELGTHDATRRRELLTAMGEVLALSGRPEAAGQAFEAAFGAGEASEDERRELRRRAAEQYLKGGVADRGFELVRELLDEVDLKMPKSSPAALAAFTWHQTRLRLSSLRFKPRAEADVPARDLLRADTAWTVASGLAMVDSLQGALFAIRAPLLALRTGEPFRCARSIAAASAGASAMLRESEARRLLTAARLAASHCSAPLAEVYPILAEVMLLYFIENDWRGALAQAELGLARLLEAGRARGFEADLFIQLLGWSMNMLGEARAVRARMGAEIRTAARNGDRFLETGLRTFFPGLHLMDDRFDEARADVEDAEAAWQQGRTSVGNHFFFATRSLQSIAYYVGDLEAHTEALSSRWTRFWRSLMAHVPGPRFEAAMWCSVLALSLAHQARRRKDEGRARRELARAQRMLRIMRGSPMAVAPAFVQQVEALICTMDGDQAGALALLRASIGPLEARGMQQAVAGTRWRVGEILGGDEGAALVARARRHLEGQGWTHPERLVDALLPRFGP